MGASNWQNDPDKMNASRSSVSRGGCSDGSSGDSNGISNGTDQEFFMKRSISLVGSIGMVLGTIIGSGIFISPKGVVEATQSEALALLLWGIGGIVSMLGALSLAELACLIPRSAGEYQYLRMTYADWVGFMFAWTVGLLIKPSSQAVIAMTSAQYMIVPVFNDGCGEAPDFMVKLLAVVIILMLTGTNCYSSVLSARIQIIFMVAKIAALIIIIIGGIVMLIQGHTGNLATGFEGSNNQPGEIIMGFYSAMFAYEGWANLTYVVEEIQRPKRNIPLTFMIGMPMVIILYVMANVSYFTVMDTTELLESPAVAITWAETVIPKASWLMPMFVAMSTFGACNGSIFTSGRLFYVMAREEEMPKILSMIHRKWKTPMPAAVFNCVFAIFYIFAGEVAELIDFLGFATWLFIGFIQLSVIILRFKMKDAERTYKVPIVFPAIVFLFAMALVFIPIIDSPQIEFLYATLIILAGLIFYIPIVVCSKRPGCMRYVTVFFQLLMDVCPPTSIAKDEDGKMD